MQFTAEIVPGSIIEKKWLQIRRVGGFVNTVYFAKHGTHFYSGLLSDSEVQKIKDNPYVNLIVMSAAPKALGEGAPVSTAEPKVLDKPENSDNLDDMNKKRGRPKKV